MNTKIFTEILAEFSPRISRLLLPSRLLLRFLQSFLSKNSYKSCIQRLTRDFQKKKSFKSSRRNSTTGPFKVSLQIILEKFIRKFIVQLYHDFSWIFSTVSVDFLQNLLCITLEINLDIFLFLTPYQGYPHKLYMISYIKDVKCTHRYHCITEEIPYLVFKTTHPILNNPKSNS